MLKLISSNKFVKPKSCLSRMEHLGDCSLHFNTPLLCEWVGVFTSVSLAIHVGRRTQTVRLNLNLNLNKMGFMNWRMTPIETLDFSSTWPYQTWSSSKRVTSGLLESTLHGLGCNSSTNDQLLNSPTSKEHPRQVNVLLSLNHPPRLDVRLLVWSSKNACN